MLFGCGTVTGTAEWHSNQAYELIEQGRYDEAIGECNKAIKRDLTPAEAYFNRARAYKLQGKKAEAPGYSRNHYLENNQSDYDC